MKRMATSPCQACMAIGNTCFLWSNNDDSDFAMQAVLHKTEPAPIISKSRQVQTELMHIFIKLMQVQTEHAPISTKSWQVNTEPVHFFTKLSLVQFAPVQTITKWIRSRIIRPPNNGVATQKKMLTCTRQPII